MKNEEPKGREQGAGEMRWKLLSFVLFVVAVGAAVYLSFQGGRDCEAWATAANQKAEAMLSVFRGPPVDREKLERAVFKRDNFLINGTLHTNPGGCNFR